MNTALRRFVGQLLGVVAIALFLVLLVAFISIPLNLSRHPGDAEPHRAVQSQHPT